VKAHRSDIPSPPAQTPGQERRTGADRRKNTLGPPAGTRERRLTLDPRKPEVEEVTLSASDWVRFEEAIPLRPKPPTTPPTGS
jgi:hypothetical protein